jgi:hypothetical protein
MGLVLHLHFMFYLLSPHKKVLENLPYYAFPSFRPAASPNDMVRVQYNMRALNISAGPAAGLWALNNGRVFAEGSGWETIRSFPSAAARRTRGPPPHEKFSEDDGAT